MNGEKTQWQPIETVPKDGTEIVVYCPYEHIGSVFWYKSKNNHRGGWQPCSFGEPNWDASSEPLPTHWMPLPHPPAPVGEAQSEY